MRLARVSGNVVSTVKAPGLARYKLLLVQDVSAGDPLERAGADCYVAVDLVGAGDGDVVLIASGSAARIDAGTAAVPTDAAIVAIVDNVLLGAEITFVKK